MGNSLSDRIFRHGSRNRNKPPKEDYSPEDIANKFKAMPVLNDEEKKVLKSSWQLIVDKMETVGAQTFLELFRAHPETKSYFKKFAGEDMMSMQQSQIMLQHGSRVMAVVDKVIEVIDDNERVWDVLIEIGRQHFTHGAVPMYFDLMGPHFVIAVRNTVGNDWYEALEYHWLALFESMVYCMKFGWDLQRADEQKRAREILDGKKESRPTPVETRESWRNL